MIAIRYYSLLFIQIKHGTSFYNHCQTWIYTRKNLSYGNYSNIVLLFVFAGYVSCCYFSPIHGCHIFILILLCFQYRFHHYDTNYLCFMKCENNYHMYIVNGRVSSSFWNTLHTIISAPPSKNAVSALHISCKLLSFTLIGSWRN